MPATRHISRTRRAATYIRDGGCVYCGDPVVVGGLTKGKDRAKSATLDHCLRADDHWSVVTACCDCNERLGEPPHPPRGLVQILAKPLDYEAGRELARRTWGPAKRRRKRVAAG